MREIKFNDENFSVCLVREMLNALNCSHEEVLSVAESQRLVPENLAHFRTRNGHANGR